MKKVSQKEAIDVWPGDVGQLELQRCLSRFSRQSERVVELGPRELKLEEKKQDEQQSKKKKQDR